MPPILGATYDPSPDECGVVRGAADGTRDVPGLLDFVSLLGCVPRPYAVPSNRPNTSFVMEGFEEALTTYRAAIAKSPSLVSPFSVAAAVVAAFLRVERKADDALASGVGEPLVV